MKHSHRADGPVRRLAHMVERLENRRLLSAVLGTDGTLTVNAANAITALFTPGDLSVAITADGVAKTFATASLKSLVFDGAYRTTVASEPGPADTVLQNIPIVVNGGNGGGCFITVELESETGVKLDINGGTGGDTIGVAASGAVTVHGGAGDDSISVQASGNGPVDAELFGDAGNDTLSADGDDGTVATLSGGTGDDMLVVGFGVTASLSGGAGDDTANLSGIPGNQRIFMDGSRPTTDSDSPALISFDGTVENLFAGPGNDLVVGTPGNNQLTAGPGQDTLMGMAGNDTLNAGTGQDTLLGGDGNDVIYSDASKFVTNQSVPAGGPNDVDGGPGIDTAFTRTTDNVLDVENNVNGTGIAAIGLPATGTPGSYQNQGNTVFNVTDGWGNSYFDSGGGTVVDNGTVNNLDTFFDAPAASGGYVQEQLSGLQTVSQISFAPRPGFESRMIGGKFEASDSADFSSNVTTLYTITAAPAADTLTPVQLHGNGAYLYVRYVGPEGSYCNIADMELFGSPPVTGAISGTVVNDVTGDKSVETPLAGVTVYVDVKGDGRFDPGDPAAVTAADGTYTIPTVPAGTFNEYEILPSSIAMPGKTQQAQNISVSPGQYQTVGFIDHKQRLLTGVFTGPTGSFDNGGNTVAKAVDGSFSTYFDGPTPNGNTITIDLGQPTFIDRLSYAPRPGYSRRMVGGYFEFSTTADFSSYEFIDDVGVPPPAGVPTTVNFSLFNECRYVRYVSPAGSYGNIAEFQVWG